MATLVSAIETDFTPAAGDFIVQVTGGPATLMRKGTSGAAYAAVGVGITGALVCSNPVAGAVYRFKSDSPLAVVQADQ